MTQRLRAGWRALAALAALAAAGTTAAADPADSAPAAPRPKVCLVLSGGGARGIAHIGVLRVLEELRVPVDCIVGTSAGAVIGGAYAAGASPAEIEAAMRGADWPRLLSDQPPRPERSPLAKDFDRAQLSAAEVGQRGASLVLPRGVVTGQHLQFFLQALVGPGRHGAFDALPIPYRAIATDFETGALVVLERGDLAAAIRASMSVPGAFAPVEVDGRVLVDGGLVRNLGIDVARGLGAERIIAVNVGTRLMKRAELASILSAVEQTVNILTEQNVEASLATLGSGDVLIAPELGDFSATDFAHGASLIPAAEVATRAAAAALAPLALEPEAYAAWRSAQRHPAGPQRYAEVVVDTSALRRVRPATVDSLVGAHPDPRDVEGVITTLLGTDDFDTIAASAAPGPDGTVLTLKPVEKPWGPNYLHAGGALTTDFTGASEFLLVLDHRATWLTASGLEWRNRVHVGWLNELDSELRQPLDDARRIFLAPSLTIGQELRSLYQEHDPLSTYRVQHGRVAIDVGARLGNSGELSGGFEYGYDGTALSSGVAQLPDGHQRVAAWRAQLTIDRLDNFEFPRRGYLISIDGRFARPVLGAQADFDRLSVDWQQGFGGGRTSVLVEARLDTALGGTLPLAEAFALGGFQNLSGFKRDQVLASRIAFLRAVARERIVGFPPLLPSLYAGLSLEGADVSGRIDGGGPGRFYGGSVFVSADSALGPLYLGLGVAERSYVSLYLYVGRPP